MTFQAEMERDSLPIICRIDRGLGCFIGDCKSKRSKNFGIPGLCEKFKEQNEPFLVE